MATRTERRDCDKETIEGDGLSITSRPARISSGDKNCHKTRKHDCEEEGNDEYNKKKREDPMGTSVDFDFEIPECQAQGPSNLETEVNLSKADDKKRADESAQSSIIFVVSQPKRLQRFDPRSKCSTQMHDFNDEMKESPHEFSLVSCKDYIYVSTRRSFHRLQYCDDGATWERMADLIADHGSRPPTAAASDAVYVAGSRNGAETKSVSKYDPSLNRWEKLNEKQLTTSWSAVVCSEGYIYCIGGGAKGIGVTERVERMNAISQTWEEVAPMREDRRGCSGAGCNGKIIIAGGRNSKFQVLSSVEKYDPEANQWTLMKPMMVSRHYFQCHSIDGHIYAVFGNRNSGNEAAMEKYDVENDEWEVVDFPNVEVLSKESAAVKFK